MAKRSKDVILKTIEVPAALHERLMAAARERREKFTVYVLTAAAFRAGAEYQPRKLGRPKTEPADKKLGNSS